MKKTILLAFTLLLYAGVNAQTTANQGKNEIKSKITKVTVYPNSALVEKSAEIRLKKGENKFIITDNATSFSKDNLHFEQQDGFFITSVNTKDRKQPFRQSAKKQFSPSVYAEITALDDKIRQVKQKIKNNDRIKASCNQQEKALQNMKALKNTQTIDSVGILKEQFEFQRQEGFKITAMYDKAVRKNEELNFELQQLTDELEDLVKANNGNCNLTNNSTDIIVNIYSNRNTTTVLHYNYLVANVKSGYSYDVMLDETMKKAVFNLKTNVWQNTNENWKDCEIVFSTNEAGLAGEDGELYTWYLDNQRVNRDYGRLKGKKMTMNNTVMMAKSTAATDSYELATEESEYEPQEVPVMAAGATYENLTLSKEYTLTTKQAIGSNDKPQTIPLVFDTTKVEFKHFATPKNIEKVYYTALLPDWEDLGLQDVNADVFLNGKYIAKSFINTNSTKDTMKFSAGEDNGVKIARKVRKSSPDKGFLSSNVETTVTVTLNIKNTKNKEVDLEIKDQIPISQNADIKITNVDRGNGKLNSNTGIIKWNLTLQPKEIKEVKFSYTVKYPKEFNLNFN